MADETVERVARAIAPGRLRSAMRPAPPGASFAAIALGNGVARRWLRFVPAAGAAASDAMRNPGAVDRLPNAP